MKKLLIKLSIVIIIFTVPYTYFKVKAVITKNEVKDFIIETKGANQNNIEEIKPFYNFLKDEGKCIVRVNLKGQDYQFYVKENGKILEDNFY
ncbi:hypothetical protein ACFWM3_18650 [Gottfriedia sp. NPDC058432]|uniref:hypothetical protein n=1 Tax=Gottfriedia sp. NPDC058432 TaxID=3346497 RepID=UPI00364D275E